MYPFFRGTNDTILPTSKFSGLDPIFSYAWLGIALLIGFTIYTSTRPRDLYALIPATGSTGFISSYLDTFRILGDPNTVLQEGYLKHKPGVFRIPLINRWLIVVCGEKLIEDIRKAPDDVLSIEDVAREALSLDYTVGPNFASDMYHIGVIRSQLTRNIGNVFPEMHDELVTSFENNIPITDDWTAIKASDTVRNIVIQITNRIFVGKPMCRDPEYAKLTISFIDIMKGARAMNLLPDILKPVICYFINRVPKAVRIGLKYLKPIIEERQQKLDSYGPNYLDKPNDMLSWLMDEAQGKQLSIEDLTLRILFVNFVAINTTASSFCLALLHLAANPEYIRPIREEVDSVITERGWTRVALTHMRKLDSFLRESQRIYGLTSLAMVRKAVKDFTLSDGTCIPKGGIVSTVPLAIHLDEDRYTDSKTFNGFRFSDTHEQGDVTKNQMVTVSPDYLSFGYGRHACPGRFFAANVLKAMMAHLILTYDIKVANKGVGPVTQWCTFVCQPDPKAEVQFRRRHI